MLTIEQIDSFPAGPDLNASLCAWLGLDPLLPSTLLGDAFIAAKSFAMQTSKFRQGLTLHVDFNPLEDRAIAWFVDNYSGHEYGHSTADGPQLAICRSLLKLKYGHL